MRSATLTSQKSTDDGTFGKLVLDNGKVFFTGELPWRKNDHGTSCIPAGTYHCQWIDSPRHGWCYQVFNVPMRDMIEIHSANFMGDTTKGKVSQLLGCIALGKAIGELTPAPNVETQTAVLRSKEAIAEFDADMDMNDLMLTVIRG